jgi:hypothetical protein
MWTIKKRRRLGLDDHSANQPSSAGLVPTSSPAISMQDTVVEVCYSLLLDALYSSRLSL